MANIIDCTFNSVWDGESVVISTDAKIDLDTGKIFDIKEVESVDEDGVEVETLDREYVDFVGIVGEFEVEQDDRNDYFVRELPEVVTALETAESTASLKF